MRQEWPWVSVPATGWEPMVRILNQRMKSLEHILKYMGNLIAGERTAANGDTSPSVSGIRLLVLENGSSTTVTGFDDGEPNQLLVVAMHDSYTTVQNGPSLILFGGGDWVGVNGQTRAFATDDGLVWVEVR